MTPRIRSTYDPIPNRHSLTPAELAETITLGNLKAMRPEKYPGAKWLKMGKKEALAIDNEIVGYVWQENGKPYFAIACQAIEEAKRKILEHLQ